MKNRPNNAAADRAPPETAVGSAVVMFERGEMRLALLRRRGGFVWYVGRKPFGPALATRAAAVQFLKDLCELYNYRLSLERPPPDGEQA